MKRRQRLGLVLVLCLFCGLLAGPAAAASGFSDVPAGFAGGHFLGCVSPPPGQCEAVPQSRQG